MTTSFLKKFKQLPKFNHICISLYIDNSIRNFIKPAHHPFLYLTLAPSLPPPTLLPQKWLQVSRNFVSQVDVREVVDGWWYWNCDG